MTEHQGTLKLFWENKQIKFFLLRYNFLSSKCLYLLTVLPGIGTTNGRSHSRCSANLESVRAGSGCWRGDRHRNKVQPTTIICLLVLQSHLVFKKSDFIPNLTNRRRLFHEFIVQANGHYASGRGTCRSRRRLPISVVQSHRTPTTVDYIC